MKIVMVCTGNTCRSPMAEALMRRALMVCGIEGVEVCSAGLFAMDGDAASISAQRQMAQWGMDISGHRARCVDEELIQGALVLCMTDRHRDAVQQIAPGADAHTLMGYAGLDGDVPDPIGMGAMEYERCAERISEAVERITDRIRKGM